jgi:RNA polymerase sigma factor (sigma-70 family)
MVGHGGGLRIDTGSGRATGGQGLERAGAIAGPLYVNWKRAVAADNIDGYVHRILVRRYLDDRRLRWSRVRLSDSPPEAAVAAPADHRVAERDELVTALRALPKGQRAVLVLRYLTDLSVEDTAQALGCSVGNVKSQSARGLAALRAHLSEATVGNWA